MGKIWYYDHDAGRIMSRDGLIVAAVHPARVAEEICSRHNCEIESMQRDLDRKRREVKSILGL